MEEIVNFALIGIVVCLVIDIILDAVIREIAFKDYRKRLDWDYRIAVSVGIFLGIGVILGCIKYFI